MSAFLLTCTMALWPPHFDCEASYRHRQFIRAESDFTEIRFELPYDRGRLERLTEGVRHAGRDFRIRRR